MKINCFNIPVVVAVMLVLSSCYSMWNNRDNDPHNDTNLIAFGTGVKKGKRHLATYPPSDFTKGLFAYRKRFNQWPISFTEWASYSIEGWRKASEMLSTDYEVLKIVYSTKDTLLIEYVYNPGLKKEDDGKSDFFIDKRYQGTYLYTAIDTSYFVENKLAKKK